MSFIGKFTRRFRFGRYLTYMKYNFGPLVKLDSLKEIAPTIGAVARGFSPVQTKVFGYARLTPEERQRYISNFEIREWLCRKNDRSTAGFSWKSILDNKYLFHTFCKANGIAVPELYGLFDPGVGFTSAGASLKTGTDFDNFLRNLDTQQLAIKPVLGSKGHGIYLVDQISRDDQIKLTLASGEQIGSQELVAKMLANPLTKAHIIQERVKQHPDLDKIYSGSLNTIRIAVLRRSNGEPYFWFAALWTGARPGPDNISLGGLAIYIDLQTGILGHGRYNYKPVAEKTEVHPVSGYNFYGMPMPYWKEIIELVKKAMHCMPYFVGVGWDVAVSDQGPMLIEGNDNFQLMLGQIHKPGTLLTDEVMDIIEHYGLKKFKR
jgi:hypothetical protein